MTGLRDPIRTRRELVRDAIVLGGPAAAAAVLARASAARAANPVPSPEDDAARLTALLELEYLAEDVQGLALRSPDLSPAAYGLVAELRAQERSHARALIAQLGHYTPRPARTPHGLDAALAKLGIVVDLDTLHGERAWFTLLENLENALEGAYYEAVRTLVAVGPATLAATILASEAQHATALFLFRHPTDISLAVFEGLVEGNAASR